MTTLRPFRYEDMFKYNNVSLEPSTETFHHWFYLQYLAIWPEYFQVAESPSGVIMGYIMGKAEGIGENWHGHVSALTVAPEYRRLGLGKQLMAILEDIFEKKRCYFVDLFVKVSNQVAINLYSKLGYIVVQTVLQYYSGNPEVDAFDMRKSLSRDVHKKSVIPLSYLVRPEYVRLYRKMNDLTKTAIKVFMVALCLATLLEGLNIFPLMANAVLDDIEKLCLLFSFFVS